MAPQDQTGRIHRDAFIISTSVLLAVALLSVATRFIVRFHVQKQKFAIDDGFILIAVGCLLTSLIAMYTQVVDRMYYIVGLQNGVPGVVPTEDWLMISHQFHKWVTICNMAGWCTVMAVKFSFLFFFKKLIDRLQYFNYYWWFLVVYNLGCLGYGVSVYYIGCPFYFDIRELQCASGPYKELLVHHSVAQMVLDLIGDAMILALPICIIWKIRVQWSQKVALMASLGLTAFMVVTTIIRVAGLIHKDMVDTIWEIYWTLVSAEIGVLMAAATAFRTFFVVRQNSKKSTPKQGLKYFFPQSLAGKFQRKKDSFGDTIDVESSAGLPGIPRAQMTGIRTFISGSGKTQITQTTQISQSDGSIRTHSTDDSKKSLNGSTY